MATYKVLQDIEAEDKFLGPLTLKEFIFGAIAVVSCYLSFIFITKNLWFIAVPFLPLIVVTGFLAFPWGRDQPTETWLLAKIRFYFKPRKRVWDQTGIQELVKITAPPKVQEYLSDNLSQTEVRSRLKALADTIDSRGWAVKNVNVNMYTQPSYGAMAGAVSSDRLLDASSLPQTVSTIEVGPIDDMFDNPRANQVATQIAQSDQEHKTAAVDNMKDMMAGGNASTPGQGDDFWFMNQPEATAPGMAAFGTQTLQPGSPSNFLSEQFSNQSSAVSADDAKLLDKIHADKARKNESFRNHKSISSKHNEPTQNISIPPVTAPPDPVTMRLAGDNNRDVASLAREANQAHQQLADDEVIISLH